MRKMHLGFCALILLWGGMSFAATIPLNLTPADFNSLGSLTPVAGWPALTTTMTAANLSGSVISQAFRDTASGNYFYLYQVKNTGTDGWHAIETFSIWPFNGEIQAGYLTGNQPTAFTAGTTLPSGASIKPTTLGGPTISFAFPGYISPIDTGETSVVLYLESAQPPTEVLGNIIDGTIAQGQIIGNVPEPVTFGFLILGGLGLVRLRQRH